MVNPHTESETIQPVRITYEQLLRETTALMQEIAKFSQEHACLEPGSTEQIALEVTIVSPRIRFCKLQKEMLHTGSKRY